MRVGFVEGRGGWRRQTQLDLVGGRRIWLMNDIRLKGQQCAMQNFCAAEAAYQLSSS